MLPRSCESEGCKSCGSIHNDSSQAYAAFLLSTFVRVPREQQEMSHPLDGCRAKLARARETLRTLEREAEKYVSQNSPLVRVEKQFLNGGLEHAIVAYGNHNPPLSFAVITGEIVHHLRSSLDHLIHALVVSNGEAPTKQHQFPICLTEKAFKDAWRCNQIKGVGPTAKQLIESVQPYTTTEPDNTNLYVIGQYDNADKHRLLVVVTSVADVAGMVAIGTNKSITENEERRSIDPVIVGFGELGPKMLMEEGTIVFSIKFAEPVAEFAADAPITCQLSLDQCGRGRFAPLIPTLWRLLEASQHTIELFAGEFDKHGQRS